MQFIFFNNLLRVAVKRLELLRCSANCFDPSGVKLLLKTQKCLLAAQVRFSRIGRIVLLPAAVCIPPTALLRFPHADQETQPFSDRRRTGSCATPDFP